MGKIKGETQGEMKKKNLRRLKRIKIIVDE